MPQSARSGDMGKSIAAYGLGNAIVDTEIQLDRESLSSLGLTPGSFARAASFEADAIIKSCKHFCQETFCGGSVACSSPPTAVVAGGTSSGSLFTQRTEFIPANNPPLVDSTYPSTPVI